MMDKAVVICLLLAAFLTVCNCQFSSRYSRRRNSLDLFRSRAACGPWCRDRICYNAIGCRNCESGYCKTFYRSGRSSPAMCTNDCGPGKVCLMGFCTVRRG